MIQKGKIKIQCPTCSKDFYRWKCQIENGSGKFCSKKCCRRTEKWKKEQSDRCLGSGNPFWGGLNKEQNGSTERTALHTFIKRRLKKTKYCQICGLVPPYDLANISQEYKRDISDWKWLCRKCHMIEDGRLNKFLEYAKKAYRPPMSEKTKNILKKINKKGSFFNCLICNKEFWRKPSEIKKGNNKYCSRKCTGVSIRGSKHPRLNKKQ